MRLCVLIAALMICGCSSITTEVQHTSHPFAGAPFGPKTEEDSLNTLNLCGQREQGRWFMEQCLGYKLSDGGFYGPELTYSARAGVKWRLSR